MIARYTEPAPMSIRIASSLRDFAAALMREARSVFARSRGLAVAATLFLVLGAAVRTMPRWLQTPPLTRAPGEADALKG
jgi:hypothetical protein